MKYDLTALCALAEEVGFSKSGRLELSALIFMPEVREMCRADRCNSYGKNWGCPPASGSIDDAFLKIKGYTLGVLVQTVGETEDPFDYESMQNTAEKHNVCFALMYKKLRESGQKVLALGAGACKRCEKCTYPDSPCRFPDEAYTSMEGSGLWVSKVCELSDLPYRYGDNTIAFTSCFLLK